MQADEHLWSSPSRPSESVMTMLPLTEPMLPLESSVSSNMQHLLHHLPWVMTAGQANAATAPEEPTMAAPSDVLVTDVPADFPGPGSLLELGARYTHSSSTQGLPASCAAMPELLPSDLAAEDAEELLEDAAWALN